MEFQKFFRAHDYRVSFHNEIGSRAMLLIFNRILSEQCIKRSRAVLYTIVSLYHTLSHQNFRIFVASKGKLITHRKHKQVVKLLSFGVVQLGEKNVITHLTNCQKNYEHLIADDLFSQLLH